MTTVQAVAQAKKEAAKKRTAVLKQLRGEHAESVARTQEVLKDLEALMKG